MVPPGAYQAPGSYHGPVCIDDSPASLAAAVRHDVEPAIEIDLEPVDSVVVTTLMDNLTDSTMTDQGPARRVGIGRCPLRIEAEPRRAVGTKDRVRLAHIDIDVRMVLRRRYANALEFAHTDADFRDAAVVPELG